MELSGSLVDLVEHAYDVESPAWLENIRVVAESSFRGQLAVQAYTFEVSGTGTIRLLDVAAGAGWEEPLRANHAAARPALIRRLYLNGPIGSLRRAVTIEDGPLYTQIRGMGVGDVWGVLGLDPTGFGCALHFMVGTDAVPSRATRQGLGRIAAHLASAQRMRKTLQSRTDGGALVESADAVLTSEGGVVHAQGDARTTQSRTALRDAVRRMERARRRATRTDADTALGLWRALVDGRWSLLERFESDGRRVLVACRNDPASRPGHALSELERKVVALLAVGHSLKLCAYELGRAESTAHALAASAMRKMGIESRGALVELHGALVSDDAPAWPLRTITHGSSAKHA